MNNILYTIKELNNDELNNNGINIDMSKTNILDDVGYDMDILLYNTYNIKQLSFMLQFYNITRGRMCKDEIIQTIILFETDDNNLNIVNKRKYLWSIAAQLKNDDFFSKYIVIDIK
jgi:hypothetical protein